MCSIIPFWDKKAMRGYSISGYLYGIRTMASVYSDQYQRVINALKKARKERGITQAQLAEALGKPQSFIAKVESGERRLDVVEFVHLAQLVELEPSIIINEIKLNN
jgi:ribosome-binding protein aMBF1 (putative translation factor)